MGLLTTVLACQGTRSFFLAHGFTVLMPDARAHGESGGAIATYGLLERDDIHQWVDFLRSQSHVRCVYGLGESMGGAELLQSLATDAKFCGVVAESPFSTFRERLRTTGMGQPFHFGPWVGRTVLLRPLVEAAFLRARWEVPVSLICSGYRRKMLSPTVACLFC